MSRFWSDIVHSLTPYAPGEQPQIDNLVKLNTNENPYPPSPQVLAAIKAASDGDLRKYPDPAASDLKATIADYYQLTPQQVFVGNSSDEVLAHVFKALLQHDEPLLFPDITYSFYPVYCQLFQIDYQTVPLDADFRIDTKAFAQPNGGIIFANPNAPTGLALTVDQIKNLLETNTESVVVVDEAYVDFCSHSAVRLVNKYPNLLVIQTLSKSRALAGLRVGMALGNARLIDALERVKNSFHPYALSRLAIAGAIAAFEDQDYFTSTRDKVIATRRATIEQLTSMGFSVLDSDANFVLATHPGFPAATLFSKLRAQGVVVRYFDKPRLRDYLRISIGSDDEMARFFTALEQSMTG